MRRSPRKGRVLSILLLTVLGFSAALWVVRSAQQQRVQKRVILLGMDGLDPQLLDQYMRAGKLPNFRRLAASGSYVQLQTSVPAQSPVAWSNLITGMDPGGHGIFDFIHRDPQTMLPYLSTSEVKPPNHTLRLGEWVFPLWGGGTKLLRQGKAFWQFLDEHRVPAVVFRMPANFPPVESDARTFAGMGTPDILGTYGTFSFYTDLPPQNAEKISGGRVYTVSLDGSRVSTKLVGPPNTFRKGQPPATIDFTVWIDPVEPVAKIALPDREILLREREWSEWVPVEFPLIPYLESVQGICRFYLQQVRPQFQLYVTPINLNPAKPALPLSTPEGYAWDLWKQAGYFYTQGIAEDTKALTGGILDDAEYLEQARMVLGEQLKIFDIELRRFRQGLFFFYFSSLDQNAHMFWRAMDAGHPARNPETADQYAHTVEEFYEQMDGVLGQALEQLDEHTVLLVVSDHGFAPYYRSFNLNTWLLENGYLSLKADARLAGEELLTNVDWSRTRAYGLGLNGLYLNLRGRESQGVVPPGPEAKALLKELADRLLALRDPATQLSVITRVDTASEIYSGANMGAAPDLVIGYNRGYRAGWSTVLGGFSWEILEDNTEPWSGDHCMDPRWVPGVLLSNRKVSAASPSLLDVAPTILTEFGIRKPEYMRGRSVFVGATAAQGED